MSCLRASMSSWCSSKVSIASRSTQNPSHEGSAGGIVEKEMPIQVSNVALFNPATQRPIASGEDSR